MMTLSIAGMLHPSLAAMIDAVSLKVKREALHERFTKSAVAFMIACVNFVLRQKIGAIAGIHSKLLDNFRNIFLFDSTSWDIHSHLQDIFPGSKGSASSANCKVQLCYEYLHGSISFFDIVPGTMPDNKYTVCLPNLVQSQDLLIIDLGYFCLKTFKLINEAGAYFLSRFMIGTTLYDAQTHMLLDLYNELKNIKESICEISVLMGAGQQTRVSCRLICLRVSEEVAQKRRRKLNKDARRKCKTVSERNLFFADWIVMITNIPQHLLPSEMVRPLYSLRWQIELLFKQMKSVLKINKLNTKNENRLRCEVLGKLIVTILIHNIHAHLNIHLWNTEHQEISFDKLFKRIQERLINIIDKLLKSIHNANMYLQKELDKLSKNCRKLKQKCRLSTLEILDTMHFQYFNYSLT
jgi:Transposase DDE domain